jgi:hypothetical protein
MLFHFSFFNDTIRTTTSNDVYNCVFVLQVARNHSDFLYEINAPFDQYKKKRVHDVNENCSLSSCIRKRNPQRQRKTHVEPTNLRCY